MNKQDLAEFFYRYLGEGNYNSTMYSTLMRELQRRSLTPNNPHINTDHEIASYNFLQLIYEKLNSVSKTSKFPLKLLSNIRIRTYNSDTHEQEYSFSFSVQYPYGDITIKVDYELIIRPLICREDSYCTSLSMSGITPSERGYDSSIDENTQCYYYSIII